MCSRNLIFVPMNSASTWREWKHLDVSRWLNCSSFTGKLVHMYILCKGYVILLQKTVAENSMALDVVSLGLSHF